MITWLFVLSYAILDKLLLAASTPEIQLGKTRLVGRDVTGLQQDFFGGIPFAEPPVGALRFQRRILKTDIDADVCDAQNFGLPCLQRGLPAEAMSEDCLTINILRPKMTTNVLLPVMFWTYGGGFFSGASSSFNGSNIVAQSVARGTPVVYVNHNYRLGPLGFPQGPEAESSGRLNLGAKDQIAALEWVQQNIGLFGGDKSKVMVFGESAGAMLTNLLFLMPSFPTLARAAIFESGALSSIVIYNASTREPAWENFVAGTPGCESVAGTQSTFDCLLQANTSAIYQGFSESYALAIERYPFVPSLDGPSGLLPDLPPHLWENGEFARLPFISGTNLDEGRLLERLLELYPDNPSVGSLYGTGEETFGLPSGFKRVASMSGDLTFDAQRRIWTQTAAGAGAKAYGYQFTQNSSSNPPSMEVNIIPPELVPHEAELDFVYGSLEPSIEPASSILLGETMVEYWISFATSLDPNDGLGISRPIWPQYTPENEVLLQLHGENITVIPDDYRKEQIEFLRDNPDVFNR
ncbi:triacylglycerol lipase 3 [Desarmillaria tabescens]|uniref:Carboxylic ester hydrolase n=1 Tax=Armillaria tabescens TaxID=1929756 RepID=A0AA39MXG1_ARMTA|nr:triacylglycerol lipase 3 [Desarmillaria tabescens]KAK0450541.1 triacylglycerol lipase 3 [Desarmillaria tabescens]